MINLMQIRSIAKSVCEVQASRIDSATTEVVESDVDNMFSIILDILGNKEELMSKLSDGR